MTALALVLALALLDVPGGGPADAGPADGGGPRPAGADGGADGGAPDPDAEMIEHLDLLERLELLDHLELFDAEAPASARGAAPAPR